MKPLDPETVRLALFQFALMSRADQDQLLASTHLEIKIKVRKDSLARNAQKRGSKQKARRHPIHDDFPALMAEFEIDPEKGLVRKLGRPLKIHTTQGGYQLISWRGRSYLVHRLVMMKHHGRLLKKGEEVDHLNMDKTDNRIANLRVVTPGANKAQWQKVKKGDA